jgi:predicted AlkP superfamily pyrophosphatase or phosphodiesterase
MGKVILVLADGLRYDTSIQVMGFLEGAVAHDRARRWKMRCALPSLSRPLYETLHTGLAPHDHGITSNSIVRMSRHPNVFSIAQAAGRCTAAAAYSWFAELYSQAIYDPVLDREVDDEMRIIQHGRFYTEDDMPDTEVIRDADMLIRRFEPDYLLVHPMGCDHAGHLYGGESDAYRRQAARLDNLLAQHLPRWREAGYQVLVTADHGMNAQGWHGGTGDEVTTVPFYHFGGLRNGIETQVASQLSVTPTVLSLMGLAADLGMVAPVLT